MPRTSILVFAFTIGLVVAPAAQARDEGPSQTGKMSMEIREDCGPESTTCAVATVDPADVDPDNKIDLARMLSGKSAVSGKALDKAIREAAKFPLGSMENPVRASMPPGQRAYLDALRCPDGKAPDYERRGSGGPGPYGNIIDFYSVRCADAEEVTIIMDMYHNGYREKSPVPGFTLAK